MTWVVVREDEIDMPGVRWIASEFEIRWYAEEFAGEHGGEVHADNELEIADLVEKWRVGDHSAAAHYWAIDCLRTTVDSAIEELLAETEDARHDRTLFERYRATDPICACLLEEVKLLDRIIDTLKEWLARRKESKDRFLKPLDEAIRARLGPAKVEAEDAV